MNSYYRLMKKIEDDPGVRHQEGQKKLRKYVEGHEHAIREKAEIMVDHFHEQVIARRKIGGQARAMVVTSGIQQGDPIFPCLSGDYLSETQEPV